MKIEDKITHAIIVNQIALNHNEEIKHTNYYKQNLKRFLNLLLPELVKCEKEYDDFFSNVEKSTTEIYDAYDRYIKAVSSVPIWDCENITAMIEAYNLEQKPIQGIVNKILNNNVKRNTQSKES